MSTFETVMVVLTIIGLVLNMIYYSKIEKNK